MKLNENTAWLSDKLIEAQTGAEIPAWHGQRQPVDDRSQAILFIKPEVTTAGILATTGFIEMVSKKLDEFDVEVENMGILGWKYLSALNIMGQHYGVINKVSREGSAALTDDALAKARAIGAPEDRVLGGHEFLQEFPQFDAISLTVLWDNLNAGSVRVAPGTYAMRVQVLSEYVILLNGFHPYQLDHFHGEGQAIIVATIRTDRPWNELREKMIGDTDPTKADPSSIRAQLLANAKNLGIPVVNKGLNGIHLSAGPLEAMVEVVRFNANDEESVSDGYSKTNFGKALIDAIGIGSPATFASNPTLTINGKPISAFDATEILDPPQAISILGS